MQASDGLSLDAQRSAIHTYCAQNGLNLTAIHQDVQSGGRADRVGLAAALKARSDVLVVLKFDRLSRSIKHFCELYETHFKDGSRELVAIRESIRLDSSLGRALVSILLVFAQMEREATGERTRESIKYIRAQGYHFGKVPYGRTAIPSPKNPRYRILIDNPDEQAVLARIKEYLDKEIGLTEISDLLNHEKIAPPQGQKWTKSLIWGLKVRMGWHTLKPRNERSHSDHEVKARMHALRDEQHTYQQIADILNAEGYKPYKGQRFTPISVCKLLGGIQAVTVQTPRSFVESVIRRSDGLRPSYPKLAKLLSQSGFQTPRGNTHWWPAQVQQLLAGTYDGYYKAPGRSSQ